MPNVGRELLNVPFPEMVSSMALAIAKSQYNLDKGSVDILRIMGDKEEAPVYVPSLKIAEDGSFALAADADGNLETEEVKTSMIGAGFQPTFYQFAETIIEVKMAINMAIEREYENKTKGERKTLTRKGTWWSGYKTTVTTTPVDARYSSKYDYSVEGSSLLRTRLVPMPPNAYMQRILDMKAQAMQLGMELKMKKLELAIEVEKAKQANAVKELEEDADAALPAPE